MNMEPLRKSSPAGIERYFAYALLDRKATKKQHAALVKAWQNKGLELTRDEIDAIIGPNRPPTQEGRSDK